MAQTGTTFTLQSSSYQGRYLKLTCTSSQDIANNKTNISWTLESIGGSSGHYATIVRVNINGSEVYSIDKGYTYDAFPVTKGSTTGSISVPMGSDGNKSITIYMDAAIYTSSTTRYSDTWTLNTVPRYPTISSFSVAKVSGSSTSVSVTWAGSAPGGSINKVEYSKDNGSTWTNANTTSSPFTISGLTSNTGYNFKIRVTSSASGLTATSSAYYQSTYQQPTANISTANISGYSGLSQIKVSWSSNMDIAKVEYSRDNGSTWYNAGDPNASSGNYTYTGLSENTSYNFKVRVTATTGSCVTTSGTSSLTTRKRVSGNLYINGTKVGTSNGQTGIALKNGDTLEIKDITNNAGCGYKLFFENPDNQNQYLSAKTTGTTAISMTAEQIRQRLQYMTSVNSQGYNVGIVTLDGSDNKALYYEFFGTLSVVNSNPTFTTSNWTYQDTNANTVALTGSNQILVNGFSKLRVSVNTAASGNGYATISQYTVSGCTSGSSTTTGNIDCATATNGGTITVTAKDSRSNSTPTTKTATFKDYFVPTLTSISATRSNGGVGTQTSMTFNGTWWNANFGASANTLSASYRYKSGSTWSEARAISLTTSGNTYSFSTNQLYGDLNADGFTLGTTFTIEVTITDELNGGKSWTTTLNSGTPAIAISGSNVSIGAQYDTSLGGKLQVDGNLEMKGAIRRSLAGSGSTIPETTILDVAGSTDGFQIRYKADTADVGVTRLATQDDANAQLSLGNTVSGTYKEALRMENGEINVFNQRNLAVACDSGNVANYPVHRIATVTAGTGSWVDKDTILEIKGNFDTAYYGLVKISLRTNDASSSAGCSGAVRWLVRSGWAANSVTLARWGVSGQNVYADVYLSVGTYARVRIAQYDPVKSWTLIKSNEVNNTTTSDKKDSVECYKDVATAATQLRGQAYTATHTGADVATTNYSNSAGSATTWSGNTALTNDHATLNTGDTWIPVIASGKLQHTLRAIWSTQQHSNHNTNQHYLVTLSCLSFWNGAYNSGGSSNLTYCSGGTIQPKPVSLYDNASGSTGTITLSQTAANFNYLEIFYRESKNQQSYGSVKVYSPNGKYARQQIIEKSGTDMRFNTTRGVISGTSITRDYGAVDYLNGAKYDVQEMWIVKVIGWK